MPQIHRTAQRSTSRRRRVRLIAATMLLLLAAPLLSGCLRVQVSMGVSSNDRVSGQIVAATIPENPDDKGPQLKPPDSLAAKVRVQEYKQDGYVGSQAFFSDLSFGDVGALGAMSDQSSGTFQLQLTRAGDLVSLNGKVDLKSVPEQGSDVQFTIAFPARVATTNGTREGDSIVSWKLPAGDTSTLRAEVRYADPNTRSFAGWAGIVIGMTLGVAVIIGVLAWRSHDPRPQWPSWATPANARRQYEKYQARRKQPTKREQSRADEQREPARPSDRKRQTEDA